MLAVSMECHPNMGCANAKASVHLNCHIYAILPMVSLVDCTPNAPQPKLSRSITSPEIGSGTTLGLRQRYRN